LQKLADIKHKFNLTTDKGNLKKFVEAIFEKIQVLNGKDELMSID